MINNSLTTGRRRGGVLGELSLMQYISEHNKEYRIIMNMLSKSSIELKSRQTDLLLLTPQKVYSIEIKNGITMLTGNEEDSVWKIRTKLSGLSTLTMKNPVMQNYKHIKSLESTFYSIFDNPIEIKNIVCVTNEKVKLFTDSKNVLRPSEVIEMLREDSYLEVNYDVELLYSFFNKLKDISY